MSLAIKNLNTLELGDYLIIHPIQGRPKRLHLKLLKITLTSRACTSAFDIKLSKLNEQENDLDFELEKTEGGYILKSLCQIPFRLNGVYSFASPVVDGDEILLGFNKIICLKKQSYDKSLYDICEDKILKNTKLMESKIGILISGETGTGKTRLAKLIHDKSLRHGQFIHLNLGNFSPSLIESEIFGHKRGSFTGAIQDKAGALSLANHGTLFLDEIDSLPFALQQKLLLFLDNQIFCPVGSNTNRKVDVRIIVAAGKSLEMMVKQGYMREDFYYRIASGHSIKLKPLRDDLENLANLIQKFSIEKNIIFSSKLIDFYLTLPWPGNIRQLYNHLQKKVILKKSRRLDFDEVDQDLIVQSSELGNLTENNVMKMRELKIKYAKLIYFKLNQNLEMSAKSLGINHKTMKSFIQEKLSA